MRQSRSEMPRKTGFVPRTLRKFPMALLCNLQETSAVRCNWCAGPGIALLSFWLPCLAVPLSDSLSSIWLFVGPPLGFRLWLLFPLYVLASQVAHSRLTQRGLDETMTHDLRR